MRAARQWIVVWALASAGCLDSTGMSEPSDDGEQLPRHDWPVIVIGGGELVLDCSKLDAPDTYVLFECDSVTIYACDDMSEAVLEYESGKSQRFTELRGQLVTLAARGVHDGQRIVSVRLPGDGSDRLAATAGIRRFEAPADSCGAPPPEASEAPAAAPVPADP